MLQLPDDLLQTEVVLCLCTARGRAGEIPLEHFPLSGGPGQLPLSPRPALPLVAAGATSETNHHQHLSLSSLFPSFSLFLSFFLISVFLLLPT